MNSQPQRSLTLRVAQMVNGMVGCVALLLIGCGQACDSSPTAARESDESSNIEHRTSNIEHRSETPAAPAEEASAVGTLSVTPVAFAEETAESSGSVKNVTFDDIKFEMKKDEKFKQRMLTEKVTGLFDKNIRIRGYILPTFKQSLTNFTLVRDNQECCFGPGAALYDCIIVHMVEGRTAEFRARPVTVEGKFSFEKLEIEERPGEINLRAIYRLDGVSVK
jgi:hypothetical protein